MHIPRPSALCAPNSFNSIPCENVRAPSTVIARLSVTALEDLFRERTLCSTDEKKSWKDSLGRSRSGRTGRINGDSSLLVLLSSFER
mgnify:CR=1 FL=1